MSKRARRQGSRAGVGQGAVQIPDSTIQSADQLEATELFAIRLLEEYMAQVRQDSCETPSTPVKKEKCHALTAAGEPCRAWARSGKTVCIYHDPEYRERLVESGARGGANSRASLAEQALAPHLDLTDRHALLDAAGGLAGLLLTGNLSPSRAAPLVRLLVVAERTVNGR